MERLPVLVLPGTLCTPAVLGHQADTLATHTPHIEGVRFTTQQSIGAMAEQAIAHLSPTDKAAIIGFSMGGMVAMEIYRRAPERVAKLALLNSNYHADLPQRKAGRDQQLELAREVGLEQVIRKQHLPNCLYRSDTAVEDQIVAMALELGPDCYAAQSEALATRPDASATLQSITCPTLILGGTHDVLCPPDLQARMHELVSGSKLRMVDGCGHFACLERAEEVSAALLDWYLDS